MPAVPLNGVMVTAAAEPVVLAVSAAEVAAVAPVPSAAVVRRGASAEEPAVVVEFMRLPLAGLEMVGDLESQAALAMALVAVRGARVLSSTGLQ